jgi:hypothetical protein
LAGFLLSTFWLLVQIALLHHLRVGVQDSGIRHLSQKETLFQSLTLQLYGSVSGRHANVIVPQVERLSALERL